MSDSKKPKSGPPQYLPRTWKPAPEPPSADATPAAGGEPRPRKKKKDSADAAASRPTADPLKPRKKKKKVEAEPPEEGTTSKLEETPLLDTYEARQRIRIAAGSVLSLVALVTLIVVVRRFQPATPDPNAASTNSEPKIAVDPKESAEQEAKVLVDSARQSEKLGRTAAAVTLLQKVARNYEGTAAAREATLALDRDRRNRPLFEVEEPRKGTPATTAATPGGAGATPASTQPAPPPVAPPQPPPPPPIVARPLPDNYRADTAAGLHPTGWPIRITCEKDGMVLLLVPGGEFLMGRDDGETTERPAHRVRLGTFYVDQHEVTVRQYQTYLKVTGRPPESIDPDRLDLPVTAITAREARSYCQWANRRLPTEAQWEFAARSSDGRISYGIAAAKADPRTESPARTLRVAMFDPADRSPFGAFDMAGNAAEWTSDYYDPTHFQQSKALALDPAGPAQSRVRPPQVTVKGNSRLGILTDREGWKVDGRQPTLGFRGVLPVEFLTQPSTPTANTTGPAGAGAGAGMETTGGVIPF